MRSRRFAALGAFFVLLYVALSIIAGVMTAEGTLHPKRRALLPSDEIRARTVANRYQYELQSVSITASDGVILRGWSIRPPSTTGAAVILLHGVSDHRGGMIGYAELLLNRGFSVLMPDARGHGDSGGPIVTYGLLESEDIHRWFEWLQIDQHPDCIFGFAESMGAAQLLQSLLNAEQRFCAVIAESPFSSLLEIAYDRVGQFFHTGPWLGRTLFRPMVETAFSYAKWKYKLDLERVSPEAAVAVTSVPVLLIHGRNDHNIPIRHSRRIAARNSSLKLWEVPAADHGGAIASARPELEQRMIGWFAAALDRRHPRTAERRRAGGKNGNEKEASELGVRPTSR